MSGASAGPSPKVQSTRSCGSALTGTTGCGSVLKRASDADVLARRRWIRVCRAPVDAAARTARCRQSDPECSDVRPKGEPLAAPPSTRSSSHSPKGPEVPCSPRIRRTSGRWPCSPIPRLWWSGSESPHGSTASGEDLSLFMSPRPPARVACHSAATVQRRSALDQECCSAASAWKILRFVALRSHYGFDSSTASPGTHQGLGIRHCCRQRSCRRVPITPEPWQGRHGT